MLRAYADLPISILALANFDVEICVPTRLRGEFDEDGVSLARFA